MALRAIKESVLGRLALPPLEGACRRQLHEALLERLTHETHGAGCERKLMRVLIELRQLPKELGREVPQVLWARSKTLIKAADPKVREKGLIFSGEVLAAVLREELQNGGSATDVGALEAMLAEWLAVVEEQAEEARHVDERTAAVGSLCRSSLLHLSKASLHALPDDAWLQLRALVVRGWLLALLLLQDDDEEARCMMARAVSEAAVRAGAPGAQEGVGVQAAKAIELVFHHVSGAALGASEPAWQAFLAGMVTRSPHAEGSVTEMAEGGKEGLSDEAMARRLFEKECDNFQAEELLIIQLSALHLRRRVGEAPPQPLVHALTDKRDAGAAVLARLEAQVAAMQSGGKGTSWAGGATSRLDVFLDTYRMVLACFAWGVGGEEEEAAALKRVASGMAALEAHPLLLHALHLTQQAARSGAQGLVSEEGLPLMWLTSHTA